MLVRRPRGRYRRPMRGSWLVWVVLCLGCGGQTAAAPPTEEAPAPSGTPAAEPEKSAAPAEPPPAEAPTAQESAAPAASASASAGSTPCAKLPKTECKIRRGCAWNDLNKCVTEGP